MKHKSGNKYLYSIPYSPVTNSTIEGFFNQIKHKLKLNRRVLHFNELKEAVKKSIKSVTKNNYKNYFEYAYKKKDFYRKRKLSTKRRVLKKYKE